MKVSLIDLKSKFETGDIPTGQDFIDLIDTLSKPAITSVSTGVYSVPIPGNTTMSKCASYGIVSDVDGCFNTSTGYFICKTAGTYRVTLWIDMGDFTTRVGYPLFKNDIFASEMLDNHNLQHANHSVDFIINLAVNDTLIIARANGLAASCNCSQQTFEWIGA